MFKHGHTDSVTPSNPTNDNIYVGDILDEYQTPTGKQLWAHGNSSEPVLVTNASCGDSLQVQVEIVAHKLLDIAWDGNGCVVSTVCMSRLVEYVRQHQPQIDIVLSWTNEEFLHIVGWTDLLVGRHNCALLSLRAVRRAIEKQ